MQNNLKIEILVNSTHYPCLLLVGVPERKSYEAIEADIEVGMMEGEESEENGYWQEGDFYRFSNDTLIKELFKCNYALSNYHNYPRDENRFYCNFDDDEINEYWFNDIDTHVTHARSTRFEFGEVGE